MSSKEDPDYEPTKFRRKELSSRDSKLSYIIFFSILAVTIGIANVVVFNFPDSLSSAKRELSNCTIGSTFTISPTPLSVWATVGIFSVFSFIVAPIAKSTTNAWSPQTTAFYYMAPLVALLSLAIAVAAGFLGYCTGYLEGKKILSVTNVPEHPKVFYAFLDLLLIICEIAVFFLLLSAWFQIRSKRNRSIETKEKEDEEKLKKKTNKEATNQTITTSETPTQTEVTSTTVSPEKNTTEESPATKTTPNVYFIQAPAAPASNPPPPPQEIMNPYSPYGYNPGYFDPYDVPYYPTPMPPPPLPPQPPRRPARPRPLRPGFRPFRKGYGVRINRGYSVFPY